MARRKRIQEEEQDYVRADEQGQTTRGLVHDCILQVSPQGVYPREYCNLLCWWWSTDMYTGFKKGKYSNIYEEHECSPWSGTVYEEAVVPITEVLAALPQRHKRTRRTGVEVQMAKEAAAKKREDRAARREMAKIAPPEPKRRGRKPGSKNKPKVAYNPITLVPVGPPGFSILDEDDDSIPFE